MARDTIFPMNALRAAGAALLVLLCAAAPAQAQAQSPTDAIQPIVQNLPHTPALPPGIPPQVTLPPIIPGFSPGLVPLPNGPEDIPLLP